MNYVMIQRTAELPSESSMMEKIQISMTEFFKKHFFRFEEHRWARYRKYQGD